MSYIASWSGGKDSCLALYQALESGYEISHLVNFISKKYHRVSFHGTEAKLVQLQSQAIGIPLLQKETNGYDYEQDFKAAVRSLITEGVEGMVFGDIYLDEHKEWVERVCGELGIQAVEPIWGKGTENVITSFIDVGFKAVLVSAQAELIDEEWIGRQVDNDFVEYLRSKNIDLCGENGEYHTVVVGGAIFKKSIEIVDARTIRRSGYWFLDTVKYQLKS